jgi:uncharacterized phage-associated protein
MGYFRNPPYDARAVANYFLSLAERDGKTLDQMKLQKLVYLAHGWSLALLDEPLITDKVEAWRYGPVIRSLYRAFANAGRNPITKPAYEVRFVGTKVTAIPLTLDEDSCNERVRNLIEEVWKVYSPYTGIQLSNYTHQEDSPWARTWKDSSLPQIIPDETMALRRNL